MKCLFCFHDHDESVLAWWWNQVAHWASRQHPPINPNLYCPRCLPTEKERCIGCGLHWPTSFMFRRSCKVCRMRTKKRDMKDREPMTNSLYYKLYRET